MNKLCCLIMMLLACRICDGQVLCIYCYDQNDTISAGINNLLTNAGFENNNCTPGYTGDIFCPNSGSYACDIVDWTCTGGGSDTYARLYDNTVSTIVEGTVAAYFGNQFSRACSAMFNDTSCLNNIDCTVSGTPSGYPQNFIYYGGATGVSLEQTVSGLISGNTYILEFWAGGEYESGSYNFSKTGLFAVDVGFGDTLLRNRATGPLTGIGTRFIVEFNAISSSHTIKFTNWGHICDSCSELVLDDVRLYTLAELSASVPHCASGINDAQSSQNIVNLFPNPVTNELNIKTNSNDLLEISMYDIISGKLLQQQFISSATLNTAQLAKGIYLYEVRNKNGVIKKGKVVKE